MAWAARGPVGVGSSGAAPTDAVTEVFDVAGAELSVRGAAEAAESFSWGA